MNKTYQQDEAQRLYPLIRSIGREISARSAELARIRDLVAALAPTGHVHGEQVRRLESEASTQLREIRHAEKELSRLGCRLEADGTVRILIPAEKDDHVVEGFLGCTRFAPAPFGA
jgi:hypothetical protein